MAKHFFKCSKRRLRKLLPLDFTRTMKNLLLGASIAVFAAFAAASIKTQITKELPAKAVLSGEMKLISGSKDSLYLLAYNKPTKTGHQFVLASWNDLPGQKGNFTTLDTINNSSSCWENPYNMQWVFENVDADSDVEVGLILSRIPKCDNQIPSVELRMYDDLSKLKSAAHSLKFIKSIKLNGAVQTAGPELAKLMIQQYKSKK